MKTTFIALGPDDDLHGPFATIDEAKDYIEQNTDGDGYTLYKSTAVAECNHKLVWTKPK